MPPTWQRGRLSGTLDSVDSPRKVISESLWGKECRLTSLSLWGCYPVRVAQPLVLWEGVWRAPVGLPGELEALGCQRLPRVWSGIFPNCQTAKLPGVKELGLRMLRGVVISAET